jgi:predicted nucleic acid-binding protein
MSSSLIDSTVLIDYLRGRTDAAAYLDAVRATDVQSIHIVVAAEVIEGARNAKDQAALATFLSTFNLVLPNEVDSALSVDLLKAFRLSHGVGWPDCLIAATALRLGWSVVTTNLKHFSPLPSLKVVQPY